MKLEGKKKNGRFRERDELGKSRNALIRLLFWLAVPLMSTSSLCSVQVPGVWVPWLWAYCGEISFYWLSSGAAQLCLRFYIPYQVIFQNSFGLRPLPPSRKLLIPGVSLTKKEKKNQNVFFLVFGFLFFGGGDSKITMDFSCTPYLLCSWIELSLLLVKKIHLWERKGFY